MMEEDYQLKQEAIKLFRQLGETSPAQKQYGLSQALYQAMAKQAAFLLEVDKDMVMGHASKADLMLLAVQLRSTMAFLNETLAKSASKSVQLPEEFLIKFALGEMHEYEPVIRDYITENYTEDDELTVFFVKLMEE